MSHARGESDRPPTQPGYVVRLELEELGMTVSEAPSGWVWRARP